MKAFTKCVVRLVVLIGVILFPSGGSMSIHATNNFKGAKLLSHNKSPPSDNNVYESPYSASKADFETYYYDQTLDHFNYAPDSYATFKQKYVINSKHWGGANSSSPIFAFLGAEEPLNDELPAVGLPLESVPRFKALFIHMEHRFYGESIPFNSTEAAMRNATIRGYFSSAQALADFAEILLYVKAKYSSLDSPVIAFGGSYGGMLAAWFRLKYPHVVYGALASSAPILYFDNIIPEDGYFSSVSNSFKVTSENCYNTIKKSWLEIEKIGSQPGGLSLLAQKFNTCTALNATLDLEGYLSSTYAGAAQYNNPSEKPLAALCSAIEGAKEGNDTLAGIVAGALYTANKNNMNCVKIYPDNPNSTFLDGWTWQSCSEMVFPIGISADSMFFYSPFNMTEYNDECESLYGITPRSHWATTYYGGNDIRLALQKFASNIIFANGLRDPYSVGGVLEDLSDSLLAVYTSNGSHCLDMSPSKADDPEWLLSQRQIELKVIQGWIGNYYSELFLLKDRKMEYHDGDSST